MLEEFDTWDPEIKQRWDLTRKKGLGRYLLKFGLVSIAASILFFFLYTLYSNIPLHPFPAKLLGIHIIFWIVAGTLTGLTKWHFREQRYLGS